MYFGLENDDASLQTASLLSHCLQRAQLDRYSPCYRGFPQRRASPLTHRESTQTAKQGRAGQATGESRTQNARMTSHAARGPTIDRGIRTFLASCSFFDKAQNSFPIPPKWPFSCYLKWKPKFQKLKASLAGNEAWSEALNQMSRGRKQRFCFKSQRLTLYERMSVC